MNKSNRSCRSILTSAGIYTKWSNGERGFYLSIIIALNLFLINPSLAFADELILRDQPLTESEKLITIDLSIEDNIMGQVQYPIKILESQITIGKEYVFFIPPQKSQSTIIITPDRSKRDLYLIRLPFTLHETTENKYYQKVRFQIGFKNRDAIAFDLLPKNVTTEENVIKTYTLSPQLKFKGVEGSIGGITNTISFESLHPFITAFGEGESLFYWIYTSQQEQSVSPGTKNAIIILDVPHGTKSVNGYIFCEAIISHRMFGKIMPRKAKTKHYPFKWNLNGVKSFPR